MQTRSRGSSVVLKSKITVVLFCVAFLMGCAKGMIRAEAIDGTLRGLCDRHDSYVVKDDTLSSAQKETNLRDSALLRKVLDEAQKTEEADSE